MTSTVRVPEHLAPIFEAAERSVSQFFSEREFCPEKGTIEIFGERYMLLRGPSISVEFFQLCRKLFDPDDQRTADLFAAGLLYELAHVIGKSDAMALHQKMQLQEPVEKLSAGPVHFAHMGWASVDILDGSNPTPNSNYFLAYKHPYSFESDAWMNSDLVPTISVCVMNAGYSSGWCEASFGIPLEARELRCRALGHEDCLFVMAQPQVLDDKASRYLRECPEYSSDLQSHHCHQSRLDPQHTILNNEKIRSPLSPHLLTYSRNLEAAKLNLHTKVNELNAEIRSRKAVESSLSRSEKKWRELSEVLFDSIMVCTSTSITHVNHASESLFGRSADILVKESPKGLLGIANFAKMERLASEADAGAVELEIVTPSRVLLVDAQCFRSEEGEFTVALRDVSDRVRDRRQLENRANYDSLTELPNRATIEKIVSRQIENSRDGDVHALFFLDLDKFKSANDTYGHSVGDVVLQEVASRVRQTVRAGDVLSRVGGDEFLLWLPYMSDLVDVESIAGRVLESLHEPILVEEHAIEVSFSIGITIYPENGQDFASLCLLADRAMYQAKDAGSNTYRFYREPTH